MKHVPCEHCEVESQKQELEKLFPFRIRKLVVSDKRILIKADVLAYKEGPNDSSFRNVTSQDATEARFRLIKYLRGPYPRHNIHICSFHREFCFIEGVRGWHEVEMWTRIKRSA